MAVPEAAVYEDGGMVPGKHNVRYSRQTAHVKAISKAQPVEVFADGEFRRSVSAPDSGHHAASCGRIDDVGHQAASRVRWVTPILRSMMPGFMMRAISAITGTTTELPNCS